MPPHFHTLKNKNQWRPIYNELMNDIKPFDEYGAPVPGCFRPEKPECPFVAVIPAITVEDKSGMKNLADCLVHVANINTTFYIDDKHRITKVWAGPVEASNYDLEANELGLRSQFLVDFVTGIMAYYDATGNYRIISLTEGE